MEYEPNSGFYARLTGGFSLQYKGRPVTIHANPQCRYMRLLLLLLKAGPEGMERDDFYGTSGLDGVHAKKRTTNFRQQLYKLRKAVSESDMPEGRYIVLKKGRYYFTLDQELHTDTERLDILAARAKELEKKAWGPGRGEEGAQEELVQTCLDYCRTYQGELLPMLGGEEWVTIEAARYQKEYTRCLKKLDGYLKGQERYEELLELYEAASQYHPYDGWQENLAECLTALNRPKEAQKVYEQAEKIYYQELGVVPPEPNAGTREKERRQARTGARILAGVKKELEEKGRGGGAYRCSYPSFLDAYRVILRMGERDGTKNTLLLCTLPEGVSGTEEETESRMEELRKVLEAGTRIGDVYTRYSKRQYLVLLAGTDKRHGREAAARLEASWKRAGPCRAQFTVQEAEGPEPKARDVC